MKLSLFSGARTSKAIPRGFSHLRGLFVAFALLVLPSVAWAESAQSYLKAKQSELSQLVEEDSTDKLVRAFDDLLDYPALAEASLGEEWGKLTADQRAEFQSLLIKLVQRSYKKSIKETLVYTIEFVSETDAPKGKLVRTTATHKTDARKEKLSIDYLVRADGAKWRVYDIVTEGSSLVSNYRTQFKKVIEKKGFSGLIEQMTKKAQEK